MFFSLYTLVTLLPLSSEDKPILNLLFCKFNIIPIKDNMQCQILVIVSQARYLVHINEQITLKRSGYHYKHYQLISIKLHVFHSPKKGKYHSSSTSGNSKYLQETTSTTTYTPRMAHIVIELTWKEPKPCAKNSEQYIVSCFNLDNCEEEENNETKCMLSFVG